MRTTVGAMRCGLALVFLLTFLTSCESWCPLSSELIESDSGCDVCECCKFIDGEYHVNCSFRSLSTVPVLSTDVTRLDLSCNDFESLKKSSFPWLPKLKTLDFFTAQWLPYCHTSNLLQSIAKDAFVKLPELRNLSIGIDDIIARGKDADLRSAPGLRNLLLDCKYSYDAREDFKALFRGLRLDYLELLSCDVDLDASLFATHPKHVRTDLVYDMMPSVDLPGSVVDVNMQSWVPRPRGKVIAHSVNINCSSECSQGANGSDLFWVDTTTAQVSINIYNVGSLDPFFGRHFHSLNYNLTVPFSDEEETKYMEAKIISGLTSGSLNTERLTLASTTFDFRTFSVFGENALRKLIGLRLTELTLVRYRVGRLENFDFKLTKFICIDCQLYCFHCFMRTRGNLKTLIVQSRSAVFRQNLSLLFILHPTLQVVVLNVNEISMSLAFLERYLFILPYQPNINRLEISSIVRPSISMGCWSFSNLINLNRLALRNLAITNGETESGPWLCGSPLFYPLILNLTNLLYLELSDVSIHDFEPESRKGSFDSLNLSSLKELHMTNTPYWAETRRMKLILQSVSETLKNLTFSEQAIDCIPRDFFSGATKLSSLDLSKNRIQVIKADTFGGLFMLRHLDISRNWLSAISSDAFRDQTKLSVLDISYNRLRTLDGSLFSTTLVLSKLTLDNNVIEESEFLVSYLSELRYLSKLSLKGNKFTCTCGNRKFRDWINDQRKRRRVMITYDESCPPSDYVSGAVKFFNYSLPWMVCDFHMEEVVIGSTLLGLLMILMVIYMIHYYRYDMLFWWVLKRRHKVNRSHSIHPERRFHAFLSYSSSDQLLAEYIFFELEGGKDVKFKIGYDCRDFRPGYTIADNIIRCIDASEKVIFLISREFIKRDWTTFELNFAHMRCFDERKNLIILLFVEKLKMKDLPKRIQVLTRHVNYLEYPEPADARAMQNFWHRLRLALAADTEIETDTGPYQSHGEASEITRPFIVE